MIDNLELIKPLLKFPDEDSYYFLQLLWRKKDRSFVPFNIGGSNNNSRLLRAYYITSIEKLERDYDEIKAVCDFFKCRAMINLNRRSFKSSSHQMMVRLAQSIQAQNYRNQAMWNNVSGVYNPVKDKKWLIDIDGKEVSPLMMACINYACEPICKSVEDSKIYSLIPSKNGVHIITKPFNLKTFKEHYPDVDIHKNNPTNLYIPKMKKDD